MALWINALQDPVEGWVRAFCKDFALKVILNWWVQERNPPYKRIVFWACSCARYVKGD